MKRKILLIYALLVLIPSRAQMGFLMQSPMPKHEVRGVWVTTLGGLDWPATKATTAAGRKKQQEELCTLLDELKASGINTVFLQTRVRGTVIYPSSMEPWDASLTGVPERILATTHWPLPSTNATSGRWNCTPGW